MQTWTVCVLIRALVLSYSASFPVVAARWSGSGTAPRGSRIWLGPMEVRSRDGPERSAPSLLAVAEEDGSCHTNCAGEKRSQISQSFVGLFSKNSDGGSK